MHANLHVLHTNTIDQRDLRLILGLDAEIEQLSRLRRTKIDEVLDKLLHGKPVEVGQHTAAARSSARGAQRRVNLEIDGRLIK